MLVCLRLFCTWSTMFCHFDSSKESPAKVSNNRNWLISYVGRCTIRTTFAYCTGQHAKIHTNAIKFLHCITIITGKALPSICTSIGTTAIYMSTCELIYAFTVTTAIARTVFSILSQRTFWNQSSSVNGCILLAKYPSLSLFSLYFVRWNESLKRRRIYLYNFYLTFTTFMIWKCELSANRVFAENYKFNKMFLKYKWRYEGNFVAKQIPHM